MRDLRIKNLPTENGFFHIVCRTVGKAFLFEDEAEKERLLLWLDKAVAFCGVDILSWCLMSNHIHLLVKVPPRQTVSDAELDRRMRILYLPKRYNAIMAQWATWRRMDGNDRRVEEAKAKLRRRMFDISWFMKTFKQAAAQDYSARHDYSGSIWGGTRFKSVYLEGTREVLLSVAAYIHLNPVRAKMVSAPEQYPWSSWGQACARPGHARSALLCIYSHIAPASLPTWAFLKAQLDDLQARVTARRQALDELSREEPHPVKNRPAPASPPPPPIAQRLSTRAPELSSARALGSAAFVQRYVGCTNKPPSPRRPHRHLLPLGTESTALLCAVGTLSLGRSPVAYAPKR